MRKSLGLFKTEVRLLLISMVSIVVLANVGNKSGFIIRPTYNSNQLAKPICCR